MIRPVFANKSKKTGIEYELFSDEPEEIRVYPNPANSYINIDFPDSWSRANIQLLDIHGRIVFRESSIGNQIGLPSLSTGTYFLILQNQDGEMHHQKLLIRNE